MVLFSICVKFQEINKVKGERKLCNSTAHQLIITLYVWACVRAGGGGVVCKVKYLNSNCWLHHQLNFQVVFGKFVEINKVK